MRKGILALIVFAPLGFILFYSPIVRVKEVERRSEVSRELHEIGKGLARLSSMSREEEEVKEFLRQGELKHIALENLEVLNIPEQAEGTDAYLIYREQGVRYTYHLDGYTTVETK